MTGWKRARLPEQKAERREAIVSAAATLLADGPYETVTLARIARRAGITKSNIYRYFDSKEALLIELYLEDIAKAVDSIVMALAGPDVAGRTDRVARILADAIANHPRRATLMSLASGVLERNLSADSLIHFKRVATGEGQRMVASLCRVLPGLGETQAWRFIHYEHALIAGLWQRSNPTPTQVAVLSREEFRQFRLDFSADLERAVAALLHGMLAQREDSNRIEERG